MKLIIQIPCYNEEQVLAQTLKDLPRTLPGMDVVEWLIIDDGSRDGTVDVAREHGVDHILRHPKNLGLAKAFMTGLEACIDYARDIPTLVQPILEHRAEIVVGARPIMQIPHFSFLKKCMQKLGRWTLQRVSRTEVEDAPSGFRAISRKAAMQMNVFSNFSYTMETIIRIFFYGTSAEKTGKIQSLILASMLISIGFLLFIVALLADLLSVNRRLLEKLNWRVRQIEETLNRKQE